MIGSYNRSTDGGARTGAVPVAPPPAAEGDGSASQVQYLAVFILLLGFFILLNSLSTFEQAKVGVVMDSVEDAFARAPDPLGTASDRARAGALAEASRAVRELGDLILTDIPLAKLEVSSDGRTLVLVLPTAELFAGGAAGPMLRTDRTGLLNRAADVLLPREGDVRVRLEALLGTASTADTAANGPLVGAAGAIARGLTHHGAPADALTVGLETAVPGQVRLLFGITVGGRPVSLVPDPAP